MTELTADRLRALLDYDPETGLFTWRVKANRRIVAGSVAGGLRHDGYIGIRLDRRRYMAHRLAWLHVHGHWPEGELDHGNGLRSDNRLANLRECSRQENAQNLARYPRNISGHPGVFWSKQKNRWRVAVGRQHVGLFDTFEEAVAARCAAKKALHGFNPGERSCAAA